MNRTISVIKHLIVIACAEGTIDNSELENITAMARKVGISLNQLESWMNDADELIFNYPDDKSQQELILMHMINVAVAGGHFNQDDYDLCKLMADKLKFSGLNKTLLANAAYYN